MHQYIVVGEPKNCPKLFETQRPSIGWIKRPKPAVRLNSAISYIKFQTGRSMSNYKSLLSSKQVITKSKPVDQYLKYKGSSESLFIITKFLSCFFQFFFLLHNKIMFLSCFFSFMQ